MNNSHMLVSTVLDCDLKDMRIPLYDALEEDGWPLVWKPNGNAYINGLEDHNQYVALIQQDPYEDSNVWYCHIYEPEYRSGCKGSRIVKGMTEEQAKDIAIDMFKQYLLTGKNQNDL